MQRRITTNENRLVEQFKIRDNHGRKVLVILHLCRVKTGDPLGAAKKHLAVAALVIGIKIGLVALKVVNHIIIPEPATFPAVFH